MTDRQKTEYQAPKPVPKAKKSDAIKNTYTAPFMVCGHRVMPGKAYELTSADKASKKSMARVENAIKKGYLERV